MYGHGCFHTDEESLVSTNSNAAGRDWNTNHSVVYSEEDEEEDTSWSAEESLRRPLLRDGRGTAHGTSSRNMGKKRPAGHEKPTKQSRRPSPKQVKPRKTGVTKASRPQITREKPVKQSNRPSLKPVKPRKTGVKKSSSPKKTQPATSASAAAPRKKVANVKSKSKLQEMLAEVRKFVAFTKRVIKSDPSEYRMAKALFGFPTGLLMAGGLFVMVIQPMDLDPDVRNLVGSVAGLFLALGFAFSVQIRCVVLLVLPTFFGRAGRSFLSAFAIIFLLAGPVDNIVTNCREVARSLTCLASLLANHTITKWRLRLNPLKEAIMELQEEGFMVQRISTEVKNAFQPITKELEDNTETGEMEAELKNIEKVLKEAKKEGAPANPFSVDVIAKKHTLSEKLSMGQALQEKWEKKLDMRCSDVFGKAIVKCREWFGDMWDRCLDALWILGYVLCLPLKMTFFCELIKVASGVMGMDCDSTEVVEPGIGDTYQAAKEMISEVATGMKVNIQYRIVGTGSLSAHAMTAEEMRASAMYEYEAKAGWIQLLILLLKRLVALSFLLVFKAAYDYQQGYITKFQHDNIYITAHFRRIDARRNGQGKQKLLPLKKTERQVTIFPNSLALMPREKTEVVSGSLNIAFRLVMSALVVYVDYLLIWILNVVYRNSRIDYHQTGEHYVNVTVSGTGFMAEIVRSFLSAFNSHHVLDSITTNEACLPRAKELELWRTVCVFAVYLGVFAGLLFEAYGLRLRRLICGFFYRKREKMRILYLYNEMLKKRKGFLKHMRHRVRKQVRKRQLKGQTGVLAALRLQFPRLCRCLSWLATARDQCLICQEPEEVGTYQRCPTPGCNWGYCAECWKDIKRRCYACGGKQDGDSASDPDEDEDDGASTDDSEASKDDRFLR